MAGGLNEEKIVVFQAMSSTHEEILHYQRKILKYGSDAKVLLHCLNKLTKLPIGVEHLQETGIGRTINGMRKQEGVVGEEARALVNKWKEMVAAEDKSDSDAQEETSNNQAETPSDHNLNETSPSHSKKEKESKKKESRKEKSRDHTTSSSSSKSSSSREKSPDKHSSKSSKGSEKRKSSKDGDSSRSKSKQSRKRHHSQEGINSTADEEDDEDAPTQSFADALGSIETVSKKKKSKDKDKEKSREKKKTVSVPSPVSEVPSVFPSKAPVLLPKSLDIRLSDFEISPHYKPLPLKFVTDSPPPGRDKTKTAEEALSVAMAQKGSRTKVFSGNRSSGLAYVPTLFDSCIRILQQNIDALEYTGGVPFDLLRQVLERASAQQLYQLENHNPYLLDDTDELWKILCQKEYRKAVREEMETWRDLYLRCHEEREARLKSLAISHKQSMAKATPVRTTKLAFAEEVVKIHRGTETKLQCASSKGANGSNAIAEVVKMAPPSASRSSSSSSASGPAAKKPKVAPLMQKTLKLMKNRFRR
uniref:EOG090X0BTZ n=1 Tax=Scapholeberis mucronata TaxID=202097 RepID=A0A4Y7NMM0_9CRUS|nr:EOG090X0BTZ [Scapholeberis mucronata]SVE93834.1 EOG090X0BTZ [Scapholeberis mucronata]